MEECLEFLVQECVVASLPGKGVGRSSKYLSCYTVSGKLSLHRRGVRSVVLILPYNAA